MLDDEIYNQKLKDAYERLKDFPRTKLISIRRAFNQWEWPAALGNPPIDNWDALPPYRRPDMPEDTITKVDYIKPYADACLVLGVSHWDTVT